MISATHPCLEFISKLVSANQSLKSTDNTWGPLEDAENEDGQVALPNADEGTSVLLDNSNNSSDCEINTVDEYVALDKGESNHQGGNVEFSQEHYYLGKSAEQRL
uniref:Uncharacterized protein n=1 Tax=Romanomermis culicivorax TaxID=13658 RepID=A0A915JVY6_ROMCU